LISAAFAAFPLTRYTLWDVNSGALSKFASQQIGIDYGVVFPSFIRAGAIDYLLAGAWAVAMIACILLTNAPLKIRALRANRLKSHRENLT
jgi:hypothetical protein